MQVAKTLLNGLKEIDISQKRTGFGNRNFGEDEFFYTKCSDFKNDTSIVKEIDNILSKLTKKEDLNYILNGIKNDEIKNEKIKEAVIGILLISGKINKTDDMNISLDVLFEIMYHYKQNNKPFKGDDDFKEYVFNCLTKSYKSKVPFEFLLYYINDIFGSFSSSKKIFESSNVLSIIDDFLELTKENPVLFNAEKREIDDMIISNNNLDDFILNDRILNVLKNVKKKLLEQYCNTKDQEYKKKVFNLSERIENYNGIIKFADYLSKTAFEFPSSLLKYFFFVFKNSMKIKGKKQVYKNIDNEVAKRINLSTFFKMEKSLFFYFSFITYFYKNKDFRYGYNSKLLNASLYFAYSGYNFVSKYGKGDFLSGLITSPSRKFFKKFSDQKERIAGCSEDYFSCKFTENEKSSFIEDTFISGESTYISAFYLENFLGEERSRQLAFPTLNIGKIDNKVAEGKLKSIVNKIYRNSVNKGMPYVSGILSISGRDAGHAISFVIDTSCSKEEFNKNPEKHVVFFDSSLFTYINIYERSKELIKPTYLWNDSSYQKGGSCWLNSLSSVATILSRYETFAEFYNELQLVPDKNRFNSLNIIDGIIEFTNSNFLYLFPKEDRNIFRTTRVYDNFEYKDLSDGQLYSVSVRLNTNSKIFAQKLDVVRSFFYRKYRLEDVVARFNDALDKHFINKEIPILNENGDNYWILKIFKIPTQSFTRKGYTE